MRDLAQTTLDLVSIPSVTGAEGDLCTHLERWARETLPAEAVHRAGNGLVLRPSGRGDRPILGLFGHLDTVKPAANQAVALRDGFVTGCGASDMKAGVALMMAAVEAHARWAWDLVAVFYDREEGPFAENGLEALLPCLPPLDLAVMLEPTANALQLGCIGGLHAHVHFSGRRAHSARSWLGDNAIFHALDTLARLRDVPRHEVMVGGLPFYEVITPTMAWTTNSANVVPDAFTVNVNYRFAPGHTAEAALVHLQSLVGEAGRVELRDVTPPGEVCREAPGVPAWITRCGLAVESKQGWTDVARLTAHGVPAVNFGPGDPACAHQADERVAVSALEDGWRCLADLLEKAPGPGLL